MKKNVVVHLKNITITEVIKITKYILLLSLRQQDFLVKVCMLLVFLGIKINLNKL